MSIRVHTTTVGNCAARVLDNHEINDLFGFYESPLPDGGSLVIEDGGNMEAWVIFGTKDELLSLADDIRKRVERSLHGEPDITIHEPYGDGQQWTVVGDLRPYEHEDGNHPWSDEVKRRLVPALAATIDSEFSSFFAYVDTKQDAETIAAIARDVCLTFDPVDAQVIPLCDTCSAYVDHDDKIVHENGCTSA